MRAQYSKINNVSAAAGAAVSTAAAAAVSTAAAVDVSDTLWMH